MLRILRARLIALAAIAIVALAALAVACGDDNGGGAPTVDPLLTQPVTIESIEPKLSDEETLLWVDTRFAPPAGDIGAVVCTTAMDAASAAGDPLISEASVKLEDGLGRVSVPLGDAPDGPYTVVCSSANEISVSFDIARDPAKVVVRAFEHRYDVPDIRFDRNAPPVTEGSRTERVKVRVFRSGLEWDIGDRGLLRFTEAEPGVYEATLDSFQELTQTFTVRLENDDLLVHIRAEWDDGHVDEVDQRWTALPDVAPTYVLPSVIPSPRGPVREP